LLRGPFNYIISKDFLLSKAMILRDFKEILRNNSERQVLFTLPDGSSIAAHAHITEVGLVTKSFIDCGGTTREERKCQLQSWVANDYDHRLLAGKLLSIIEKAATILKDDELPVEVEHDVGFAAQFAIGEVVTSGDTLIIRSLARHTECLAPDKCCPPQLGGELVKFGKRG
jgi:hypothetical protein